MQHYIDYRGIADSGVASALQIYGFMAYYPFCIQGVDNPGWSGCSFNTFQECEASASPVGGSSCIGKSTVVLLSENFLEGASVLDL